MCIRDRSCTRLALQSIGHVGAISPEPSRFLNQSTSCRSLACRALMNKLRNIVRACSRTRPRMLNNQTARVWLFDE
eukprot:11180850-Lingulodinium_polyedra.AAC.1